MNNNSISIGNFYENMTLAEAKKKKLDKSIFCRDFSDIDKNHDGVLSHDEIILERKTLTKRKLIFGITDIAIGLAALKFLKDDKFGKFLDGLWVAFGAVEIGDAYSMKKQTDHILSKDKNLP